MSAREPRKLYSVKYGTPNIGANTPANKVPTYMNTQEAVLGQYDAQDRNQILNQELLQIISHGINDIVDALKLKLGNNFTESTQSAAIIRRRLDDLKIEIDADIQRNLPPDLNSISINPNNNYEVITGDGYLRPIETEPQINVEQIDIANDYNFNRLNDEHRTVLTGYDQRQLYGTETDFTDPVRLDIENRLKNCQNLEFLYLKKHDEIMKIFAFTINLFDKYKYAIKIVLLLLKSLVYKDSENGPPPPPPPPPFGTPRVRIPITIIPNIKKLLIDQKNIQGVINKMKTVISPDPNTPPDIILDKADANLKVQKLTDRTVSEKDVGKYIRPEISEKPAARVAAP
jgi:hypothetical protein